MDAQHSGKRFRYDVFISYSHGADPYTAAYLQRALQQIAKPWYRLRGMRVFRDETDLSVAPEGWPTIEIALADSRYFLLMASEQAASSSWVARELVYWLEHRSTDTLLIALTDGDIVWNNQLNEFDWDRTTSLPKPIAGALHNEPFWADLRWRAEDSILTLRDPRFQTVVAKLAAPVRDLNVAALISEDHKQHRRTLRLAYGAALALIGFIGIAIWQFQSSLAASERERDQRVLASVARAYRTLYIDPLQALDEARSALSVKQTPEGQEALRIAMAVAASRKESRRDERDVLGSGVGYLMERWREGDVFTKLRRDGRYAVVASERGKSGSQPPGTAYLIQLDSLRTTTLDPGEAAKGRRLEYVGFSNSGEQIFVARQFYLDIYDLAGNRTNSVQLEFHAKPTHLIAGMFGPYVLVGDTVGHLMLADTRSGDRPQLEGGRYPDAALLIESAPDANRAIVIYDSGKADLVVLDDLDAPGEHALSKTGIINAAFSRSPSSGLFLTSSKSGEIVVWRYEGEQPIKIASFQHGDGPVDLASFSGDGTRIISLASDGSFRVWDIASNSVIADY